MHRRCLRAGPAPESLRRQLITVSKSKKLHWCAAWIPAATHEPTADFQTSRRYSWEFSLGQACSVRVASKLLRGHCRTSGKCAMLRTIEKTNEAIGAFERICVLKRYTRQGLLQKDLPYAVVRHEKPARTQCLTSAAHLPVPKSEFTCPTLADPKARFCRRSPATCQPPAGIRLTC